MYVEQSTGMVTTDEETKSIKKVFHSITYEMLLGRYADLAFIRATDNNKSPVLVIPHRFIKYHSPFGFTYNYHEYT